MQAENQTDRELSMTTVFRHDLIRIQILRRKYGDDNSQKCITRALNALEIALVQSRSSELEAAI